MKTSVESIRRQVQLCLGKAGTPIGSLIYVREGRREHSTLAYHEGWLANPEGFTVSADLQFAPAYQFHKAATPADSVFHGAIADTAPDAWGRRVIARHHTNCRKTDPDLPALSEIDYLLAVDDFSRVGALRLCDGRGNWHRSAQEGRRNIPPLIELERMFAASRALECGQETTEDLRYLQGKGTSLGGLRPKCTVIDQDGWLAIGKFPSIGDVRSIPRGEVLALQLAMRAGIDAASARIVQLDDVPVAIIRRFDRDRYNDRIPYQSAASLLVASREEDRSYTEIADAIRAYGQAPTQDIQQLWRRIVFNLLITNIDDHLQNHGFLHVGQGLWRLAPVFDVNPFPDKLRESKTWLSEQDGPITDLHMLIARSAYFMLNTAQALTILAEVYAAVSTWREIAQSPHVGLRSKELDDFAPAFEHAQMEAAITLLRG